MRATRLAAGLVLAGRAACCRASRRASRRRPHADSSLPPASRKELVAIFAKKVKPLGLHVTRAALVNPAQERDSRGTHLAIYVEPTGEYTIDDYLDGTVSVSKVFLPYVFERWKGLKSFDVCQEPRPAVDDSPTPAPETQVYATRAGSKLVDWKTVDVATMIHTSKDAAAATPTNGDVPFSVFVAKHLQNTPAYQDAGGHGRHHHTGVTHRPRLRLREGHGVKIEGANVIVTGASSGIGAALGPMLAARGATVGLVARRADRLEEVLADCRDQHARVARVAGRPRRPRPRPKRSCTRRRASGGTSTAW